MKRLNEVEGRDWVAEAEWVVSSKCCYTFDKPSLVFAMLVGQFFKDNPHIKEIKLTRVRATALGAGVKVDERYNTFHNYGIFEKLRNGWYKPTPLLYEFIDGRVAIPARVYWMNGEFYCVSAERIYIHQVPERTKHGKRRTRPAAAR